MNTRPNVRHLERHALRAIAERLHQPAPWALRATERDGRDVVLHLNSGGNSLAVEERLRGYGYRTSTETNPDHYGVAVRVHGTDSRQEK